MIRVTRVSRPIQHPTVQGLFGDRPLPMKPVFIELRGDRGAAVLACHHDSFQGGHIDPMRHVLYAERVGGSVLQIISSSPSQNTSHPMIQIVGKGAIKIEKVITLQGRVADVTQAGHWVGFLLKEIAQQKQGQWLYVPLASQNTLPVVLTWTENFECSGCVDIEMIADSADGWCTQSLAG